MIFFLGPGWSDGDLGGDGSAESVKLIETRCSGCATMFSHSPSTVIDAQPFCRDECAASYRQRGEHETSPVVEKNDGPGPGSPLVSKILDTVMMDVVGDVPDDDPKTKLGRLKRQLEIKMAGMTASRRAKMNALVCNRGLSAFSTGRVVRRREFSDVEEASSE